MKNPWTKKNPFMSLWLSGANKVGNTARVRVTAEARRQAVQGPKQVMDFWTSVLTPKAPAAKRRKKR